MARAWTLVPAVFLLATQVAAQSISGFENVRIKSAPIVFVEDQAGQETKGLLTAVSTSELTLFVDGTERTFLVDQIKRVQKRGDSLKNGALIGLAVGVGMGALGARFADTGPRTVYFVLSAATYTAFGTAIDAAITGRTTLYQAPNAGRKSPVTMAPFLTPDRRGVNVVVTF